MAEPDAALRAAEAASAAAREATAAALARWEALRDTMAIAAGAGGTDAALQAIARLAVPRLADWCIIDRLKDNDGVPGISPNDTIRRLVVGTDLEADTETDSGETPPVRNRRLARELTVPLDPDAPHGTPRVLRTGKPELISHVTDAHLVAAARDQDHLRTLRELDPKSYLVVPMRVGFNTPGTLVLVSCDADRRYGPRHLEAAEDLAACAAFVLGNASVRDAAYAGADIVSTVASEPSPRELGQATAVQNPAPDADGPIPHPELTSRMIQFLELHAHHFTHAEIASRLSVTPKTVENSLAKIRARLGAETIGAAVRIARERGLIRP